MLPKWLFACAPVRAVRRDGAEHYRPFDPRPHAPDWLAPDNPIITPGPVLLGHANNQFLNFSVDPWPARGSTCPRSIEFAGNQPSVPCQDGVGQGGSRHLAEGFAAQSMANLAELRSLGVGDPWAPFQLGLSPGE